MSDTIAAVSSPFGVVQIDTFAGPSGSPMVQITTSDGLVQIDRETFIKMMLRAVAVLETNAAASSRDAISDAQWRVAMAVAEARYPSDGSSSNRDSQEPYASGFIDGVNRVLRGVAAMYGA